jgi:hypothetical protein
MKLAEQVTRREIIEVTGKIVKKLNVKAWIGFMWLILKQVLGSCGQSGELLEMS